MALAIGGLLLAAMIPFGALAAPPQLPPDPAVLSPEKGAGPFARMIEHLSELLQKLEGELVALDGPRAERLEQRLKEAIEAIEALLDSSDHPKDRLDPKVWKEKMLRIDLRLHRLVHLLEEIVKSTPDRPDRHRAVGSIERLREWIDRYIVMASVGMDDEEFEGFEKSVRMMAKFLGERISEMAKRADPGPERPRLTHIVERLEALLYRLDGLLLRRLPGKN
jgi:hypothetical protein